MYANRVGSTIIRENPLDTIRTELESLGIVSRIIYVDHHKSHALSTLSTANFEEGFALVIDAVGEFTTSSLWELKSNEVKKIKSSRIPNSLGILYSTVTQYCGFKVDSGEYKLMGLSPYGKPKYTRELKEVVRGNHIFNMKVKKKYFDFFYGKKMYSKEFEKLLKFRPRKEEEELKEVCAISLHLYKRLLQR